MTHDPRSLLTPSIETISADHERAIRERRLLAHPELMNVITDNISSGGDLIDLCNVWAVRFGVIQRFIDSNPANAKRYRDSLNARAHWLKERILNELKAVGFADLRKLYNDDGTLKNPKDMDDDTARALAGIEVDEIFEGQGDARTQVGWSRKVKMLDKLKALELAGKTEAMFVDKHQHDVSIKLEDILAGTWGDAKDVTPTPAITQSTQGDTNERTTGTSTTSGTDTEPL